MQVRLGPLLSFSSEAENQGVGWAMLSSRAQGLSPSTSRWFAKPSSYGYSNEVPVFLLDVSQRSL